jgi:hypothetical protein
MCITSALATRRRSLSSKGQVVSKERSHQRGRLHAFFEYILKVFYRPAPKVPDGLTGEALAQWLREQGFDVEVISARDKAGEQPSTGSSRDAQSDLAGHLRPYRTGHVELAQFEGECPYGLCVPIRHRPSFSFPGAQPNPRSLAVSNWRTQPATRRVGNQVRSPQRRGPTLDRQFEDSTQACPYTR